MKHFDTTEIQHFTLFFLIEWSYALQTDIMAISTVNGNSTSLYDPSIQSFAILDGDKLHLTFRDASYIFHAQWL